MLRVQQVPARLLISPCHIACQIFTGIVEVGQMTGNLGVVGWRCPQYKLTLITDWNPGPLAAFLNKLALKQGHVKSLEPLLCNTSSGYAFDSRSRWQPF